MHLCTAGDRTASSQKMRTHYYLSVPYARKATVWLACSAVQYNAGPGQARPGQARQGRQGKAKQGQARQTKARQGKARQGKARQGKARQGKARQGKARQGKVVHALTGRVAPMGLVMPLAVLFRPFRVCCIGLPGRVALLCWVPARVAPPNPA